jgi:ABC-type glutathione transport system ATPase component
MSPARSRSGPDAEAASREPLLRVTRLCKQFVQRRNFSRTKFLVSAFEDVNLQLFRGRTLALVGESGAGKSTLARCIALLERPSSGNITLDGADLLALDDRRLFPIRRRIS